MSEKPRMQDNEKKTGPGPKFFVHVAGKTNEAHHEFIETIKKSGHVEVKDRNACDYILAFCPVPSQAGADVGETMENLSAVIAKSSRLVNELNQNDLEIAPSQDSHSRHSSNRPGPVTGWTSNTDKDVVLMMHRTHNPSDAIAESSRQVNRPNQRNPKTAPSQDSHSRHSSNNTSRAAAATPAVCQLPPAPPEQAQGPPEEGGSTTKFCVHEAGKTNGAHHELVDRIKQSGHVEVKDPDTCDYVLSFCPVASRVGTDVGETVENLPADKDIVLVVMHHTFNCSAVIAESSRLVKKPNIFTVDCLFYEGKLLTCDFNDQTWKQIQRHLGISPSQDSLSRSSNNWTASGTRGWMESLSAYIPPRVSDIFKSPTHKKRPS